MLPEHGPSARALSGHSDPGSASQVVPVCHPSALFLLPNRSDRCLSRDLVSFSFFFCGFQVRPWRVAWAIWLFFFFFFFARVGGGGGAGEGVRGSSSSPAPLEDLTFLWFLLGRIAEFTVVGSLRPADPKDSS